MTSFTECDQLRKRLNRKENELIENRKCGTKGNGEKVKNTLIYYFVPDTVLWALNALIYLILALSLQGDCNTPLTNEETHAHRN